MKNFPRLTFLKVAILFLYLINSACTLTPAKDKDTAVLHVVRKLSFPFALLDFGTVDLNIADLDGKKPIHRSVNLTPGKHSVTVEALKGPTGMLGVAPFLGKCHSQFEIDVVAGKSYKVELIREKEKEVFRLSDNISETILFDVPCIPY